MRGQRERERAGERSGHVKYRARTQRNEFLYASFAQDPFLASERRLPSQPTRLPSFALPIVSPPPPPPPLAAIISWGKKNASFVVVVVAVDVLLVVAPSTTNPTPTANDLQAAHVHTTTQRAGSTIHIRGFFATKRGRAYARYPEIYR